MCRAEVSVANSWLDCVQVVGMVSIVRVVSGVKLQVLCV